MTRALKKFRDDVTDAAKKVNPATLAKHATYQSIDYLVNKADDLHVNMATKDDELLGKPAAIVLLDECEPTLAFKIDKIDQIVAACDGIKDLEVIKDTNRGQAVLQAVWELEQTRKKAVKLQEKIVNLRERMSPERPDEDTMRAVNRFSMRFLPAVHDIDAHAETVAKKWRVALTDEAIKAWVRTHPTAGHKAMNATLRVADQGINAVALTGEILGYIPNEEAQGASIGLSVGASVAETGKAVTDRWMNSVSADIQIAMYRKKGVQKIYDDLGEEDIAEMLAAKRQNDVALALQLTQPIWTAAAVKFPPGVGDLWPMVCDVIEKCVEVYQRERISRAKGLKDEESIILVFGKEYLDELLEKIKGNVFELLNPFKLATTAFITTLSGRIAASIIEKLPVKPAELIDGAALRGHIESLVTAQLNSSFLEPSIVEDRFGGMELPTEVGGVAVGAVLSGVEGAAPGRHVYLRLADGVVGRWLETGVFEVVDGPADPGAKYLDVPVTDHLGRTLSEVFAGTTMTHPDTDEPCYRARYQDLAGLVTIAAPHTFTVLGPHDTAYADWSRRSVTPEGYREIVSGKAGEMVRGIWRQPWPSKPIYVFVHASGRGREWAHGTANTGDPGQRVFGQLDGKVPTEYDLDTRVD